MSGRRRCLDENSWTALKDMAFGREEVCCDRSERPERTDGVSALAQAGSSVHGRYMTTARPTVDGHKVLTPAEGWAVVRCDQHRSRATGLWVAAAAFDASARLHTDPNVGVLQPLNLVRPCI